VKPVMVNIRVVEIVIEYINQARILRQQIGKADIAILDDRAGEHAGDAGAARSFNRAAAQQMARSSNPYETGVRRFPVAIVDVAIHKLVILSGHMHADAFKLGNLAVNQDVAAPAQLDAPRSAIDGLPVAEPAVNS